MTKPKGERARNYWRTRRAGDAGPTLAAVRDVLADADLDGSRRIWAEIAQDMADLVDGARNRQDPARYLQAVSRLSDVLERCGVSSSPVSGSADGGGVVAGGGDESDELAAILGAGATVGDSADA